MSNCFRWLHLTDLHWGSSIKDYWNEVETALIGDIKHLQEMCGNEPWDAIFFTGDLVNKGSQKEFEALDEKLTRLKKKLKNECHSDPFFSCVPGNHDLTRPKRESAAYKNLSGHWETDEDVKNDVLIKQTGEYSKALRKAFKEYKEWGNRKEHGFGVPDQYTDGLLPGDFSATCDKNGYKIGIIGLNTAFLHLREGDFEGQLYLDPCQLSKIIGENHSDWFENHHACFLLTHHPKEWLSPSGQKNFSTIAPAGQFSIHLCGHQHENCFTRLPLGGTSDEYRLMQTGSLFGLEKYINWKNNKKEIQRLHGYCAGKIEFGESEDVMRLWPRIGTRINNVRFEFDRDTSQGISKKDGGTEPLILKRRRLGPIITAPPAEPHPKETLSDYEIFIKEKIKEELLKDKLLSGFIEALLKIINEDCSVFKSSETEELASFLVRTYILESISLVSRSLNKYLMIYSHKEEKDRQTIWEHAYSIVGWLVTLAVDQKLITQFDNNKESPENHNLSDIPTMAFSANGTLEIVFSNFKKTRAEFDLTTESNGDYKITGNKGKCLDPCINIESGILVDNKLNELKSELWERVKFSKEPSKESFTNDETTILLARLVARANEKTHYFYLFFTDKIKLDQVKSAALLELRKEFNTLTIMQIKLAEENTKLIAVPERELEQQLIVFLQKKEEFIAGQL